MNKLPNRYIYFVRPVGMEGPIKIGCSNKPARRLETLSIWSPYPLEVVAVAPGDLTTEKAIHGRFAEDRWHHEWFRASERLLTFVSLLRRGMTLATAIAEDDRLYAAPKQVAA